jgi:hypothetical protein
MEKQSRPANITIEVEEFIPGQGKTIVMRRTFDNYINATLLSCKIPKNSFEDWLGTENACVSIVETMMDTFEGWDEQHPDPLLTKLLQRMRFATECTTDEDKLHYIHFGDREDRKIPWTQLGNKKYRKRDIRERLKDIFILYEAETIWVYHLLAQKYAKWISKEFEAAYEEAIEEINDKIENIDHPPRPEGASQVVKDDDK